MSSKPHPRISVTPVHAGRNMTAPKAAPAAQPAKAKASIDPALPQSATTESAQGDAFASQPSFDSAFQSVGLPTNFRLYDFKSLFVRPLYVRDQILIYNGRMNNNLRHTVTAISNCCQINAADLTVGDFWFLMYHERIVSYKKAPFSVDWTCPDGDHQMRVMNNELEAETLAQNSFVKTSDLNIIEFDDARWAAIETKTAEILAEYGLTVRPQLMRDLMEMLEEADTLSEDELPVVDFENRYAAMLDHRIHGATLKERRAVLNSFENGDLLSDLDEYYALIEHGVDEEFTVKCEVCGHVTRVKQTIDMTSFFPKYHG